ncbi:MAG: pyridoxal 5'-phosphate synthase glutaminase subunit PdxT [Armatimonadota bacterium]
MPESTYHIGVLAVQGDFAEHIDALNEVEQVQAAPVKTAEKIGSCDGLVIPGGESTTIGKLCDRFGLDEAIGALHEAGKPIWGTCAGLILLAKDIVDSRQWRLGYMNIEVKRNAFGRQVDSFEADLEIAGASGGTARGVFIRAPYVTKAGDGVDILSTYNEKIVMVRQGHLLGTAFHPELTTDRRVQQYFVEMVKEATH